MTGRVKDVIQRAGETVSALDLEEHLLTHTSIWAAAAVPLPDDYLGEKICVAVGFTGSPVSLAELNGYLAKRGVAAHARLDALIQTRCRACPPPRSGRLTRRRSPSKSGRLDPLRCAQRSSESTGCSHARDVVRNLSR